MKRSLRHPFRNPRYMRPERDRTARRKAPRQPKLHQNRFSVESVLDAPDSTAARPNLRLRVAGIAVLALFGILVLRLWTLQVLQAPAAAQAVAANQIRAVSVQPTRGLILDRYGNPLVDNVAVNTITLSRSAAAQYPSVVGRLAALIGETPAQVQAAIADNRNSVYEPVPVLPKAAPTQILYIKEHPSEFPGVSTSTTTERNYPQLQYPNAGGYPAAQTLGYVGSINAAELASRASQGYQEGDPFGQSGLEYQYETDLHGTPGTQQLEVDSKGQVVGSSVTKAATPGDNIVTNLDTPLQQEADNALASQILSLRKTYDDQCNNNAGCYPAATGGAVVVMDPRTGAVLALSSYPSYNPSVWVGGISDAEYASLSATANNDPLLNRVIQGTYTPGSTFKLNTATAALQTGLWPVNKYYDDTNTYLVPGCAPNSTATGCHLQNAPGDTGGELNVSEALTVSSDDFFYNLGGMFFQQAATYGPSPIQDQAAEYSLGQLTGIDLPAEYAGRVDSQAERQKLHAEDPVAYPYTQWLAGDNVQMAFGQGETIITPIEQAVAYSTFVNDGTRFAPQVGAAVVSPTGKLVKQITPQVTGHVALSPSTYQALLTGFEGVVQRQGGTAYGSFQGSTWPVADLAGKTGTADTEPGKEPTAWFVGFTPTPQYVVVCVIDQAGYGAQAAAPVVRDIYDFLYTHPVGTVALTPSQTVVQSPNPVQLVSPTTTTTTTPGKAGTGTTPTTTTSTTTTTTTVPGG
ncbi:MAG: penicillin-binding protein 2 [Acidimicrobiales bacterium]